MLFSSVGLNEAKVKCDKLKAESSFLVFDRKTHRRQGLATVSVVIKGHHMEFLKGYPCPSHSLC